jgi:TIR domain
VPCRIFISYARSDAAAAEAIAGQLRQLEKRGLVHVWLDRDLEAGESWEQRILEEVRRSDLILLLVSPAYLTSEFVDGSELPLIQDVASSGARVMPLIIARSQWKTHPYIGSLQAFMQGRELEAPETRTFDRQIADLVEEVRSIAVANGKPEDLAELQRASRASEATAEPKDAEASTRSRVDAVGMAYKGSQLQTQIYVNARTSELDEAVRAALPTLPPDATIEWCSPLVANNFAEYHDAAFLHAVGQSHLAEPLRTFWPVRGPHWDALARVLLLGGQRSGVLLVEGKSYSKEMAGGGSKAEGASRDHILRAMTATQEALGITQDPERWLGRYYQFANRLAHMVWLRSQGVDAWMVHLLFTDDPHGPTSKDQWNAAIMDLHAELGVAEEQLEHVGVAVVPALERSVLEEVV